MAELKISRKKSTALISDINYMLAQCKVDAIDRTPATELAFAEMIAATLPVAGQGQDVAQFYRGTVLDGVKDFLDQLCELVQINQEQTLLAVWGCYSYRMSIIAPLTLSDVRPCIGRYVAKMPVRHADMIKKYPDLADNYWAISNTIYA